MKHWHATYLKVNGLTSSNEEIRKTKMATARTKRELHQILDNDMAIRSWAEHTCRRPECTVFPFDKLIKGEVL